MSEFLLYRDEENVIRKIHPWFLWQYNQFTTWKKGYSKKLFNLLQKLAKISLMFYKGGGRIVKKTNFYEVAREKK